MKRPVLLLSALIFTFGVFAQDTLKQPVFTFTGYVSDIQGLLYNTITRDYQYSNQLHNRINIKWQPELPLAAALELRTRLYTNNSAAFVADYTKAFELDAGVLKMTKNILSEKYLVFNIAVDRLWIDYTRNKWQITLGRQRINWGQTFVWNPNDIFNTYNYLDFDYTEKPGSDAVRIQYYISETDKLEIAVKADSAGKTSLAGLYRFNRRNYDFQVISGITTEDDLVVGGGWSGQLAKGGFRGEISYFIPRKARFQQDGTLAASLGWDYMFKNALSLQFECLYHDNKSDSAGMTIFDNNAFKISAKNPFLNNFSGFASVGYPLSPLLNGSLATIVNPHNRVYILIPSFDFSLMQNLDLSVIAQLIGLGGQSYRLSLGTMYFMRVKYSF